jgi:hypothetical protein
VTSGTALFDEVVRASGLNEVVAPFTLTRLLVRANTRPDVLTPEALDRALPELERGIGVYLTPEEHAEAMRRLRALATPG